MTGILLAALLSLQTVDLAQSCKGFAQGHTEANPVLPTSCKGIIGITAGVDTGLIYLTQRHIKSPWKRALVYGALAGVESVVVYRNAQRMRTPARAQAGPIVPYECGSLIGVACR